MDALLLTAGAWLIGTAGGLITLDAGARAAASRWRSYRARVHRRERLTLEREVERRRRYYCRRALRGLEDAVADLEREMSALPAEAAVALSTETP